MNDERQPSRHLDKVNLPFRDLLPFSGRQVEGQAGQEGIGLVRVEIDAETLQERARSLGLEIVEVLDGYLPIGRCTVSELRNPTEQNWHVSICEVNGVLYSPNYSLDILMEILIGGKDSDSS